MIDFHNHVLPAVDDGSKSLEMSLNMLGHAAEQGITDVVNTVHLQHPKVETEDISYDRIQRRIANLQVELDKFNIPIRLHSGSEVFYLPNLVSFKGNQLATFGQGSYMLVEFQVHQLPETQKQVLFDLKMAGVTPIIAHPERYKPVQDDISIITDWLSVGCLIQVDAGSVLGFLGSGSKEASERIVKSGWCQILGSDAHDDQRRNFCLMETMEKVKDWIGSDANLLVNDNPRMVLDGTPIIIDYEYIPRKIPNFWSRLKHRIGFI